MDGEHGLHVAVQRHVHVELAQEHGRERGVPVVAVQDVAHEAVGQVLQALADGLGEEREALAVVEEPVGVAAVEVVLVVEEQIGHAVADDALHAAVLVAPSEGHVELADVLHLGLELVGDGGVLGHHDDDVGARLHERLGQGARDVAQAARLHEGRGLRAREHDLQFLSHGNLLLFKLTVLRNRRPADSRTAIP